MIQSAHRLLTVATALVFAACASTPHPPEVTHLLTGREFPLDAFRGRVMLLNIWATWCKPCLIEVPELAKVADEYGEKVTFVALYYQLEATAGPKVTAWLRGEPEYFSHYVAWGNPSLHALYPHRVLPTTYIIGRGGTVVTKFEGSIIGEARVAELRAAIEVGLQQPMPAPLMAALSNPKTSRSAEQASEGL
jgi:thiol-disulfide isomerase/thioredoxin